MDLCRKQVSHEMYWLPTIIRLYCICLPRRLMVVIAGVTGWVRGRVIMVSCFWGAGRSWVGSWGNRPYYAQSGFNGKN